MQSSPILALRKDSSIKQNYYGKQEIFAHVITCGRGELPTDYYDPTAKK